MATVFAPYNCSSATPDLIHVDFLKSCDSIDLCWAYPAHNLTLIIGRQQHQPFIVSLGNYRLMDTVSHIYRLIGNQETEVTTKDDRLVQHSDSFGQVKLKLKVPPEVMPYLAFVD